MRKILVVATMLLVVFVAVFRQRIFLRDPLGKVERNGVAQDGARVYINYSNDALVEDSAKTRFVLVQGWSKVPGIPQHLACVTGLACWTDANEAKVFPWGGSSKSASTVMSAKEITFVDESGEEIKVGLR